MSGIDYGLGQTNIDFETGIRFGVMSANNVSMDALEWNGEYVDVAYEDWKEVVTGILRQGFQDRWKLKKFAKTLEPYVGDDAEDIEALDGQIKLNNIDFTWLDVDTLVGVMMDRYNENYIDPGDGSSSMWVLKDEEYFAHVDEGNDVWIEKSPWVTRAWFASPCAPGAGYLSCPTILDEENMLTGECWAYCLGEEFFDEYNPMPYKAITIEEWKEMMILGYERGE